MIVDGRALQGVWLTELKKKRERIDGEIVLGLLYQGADPAMRRFLCLKKAMATSLAITVIEQECDVSASTNEVIIALEALQERVDGVVVQLPLSLQVDKDSVCAHITHMKDIDVLSPSRFKEIGQIDALVPPVVSAIKRILTTHAIAIEKKKVVVVGEGMLVGMPAKVWFEAMGATVLVVNKESRNTTEVLADADILVLGAGVGHLVTPDMIKEGAVLLDAGTSEMNGMLVGDADPLCAKKASLFTPVPGGIGPLTLTALFENLLTSIAHQRR